MFIDQGPSVKLSQKVYWVEHHSHDKKKKIFKMMQIYSPKDINRITYPVVLALTLCNIF